MDLGLTNKVALVAASSQGLGFGVAQALARSGARVSMCSRSQDAINNAAAKLTTETGADILATACDVTKTADIQKWVNRTVEKWGDVYGLLVNVGGPPPGRLIDMPDEQWQAAFELTLMSAVRMIRATAPHMKNGGSVLTVTSATVTEPAPRLGLSTVMRAGVAGMVKVLSNELAAEGIRFNNLMPGRFDTERVRQLDEDAAQAHGITFEEVRQRSENAIPWGRLGTIEEFGAAAAFLLSPAAGYITGASLRVDGGKASAI